MTNHSNRIWAIFATICLAPAFAHGQSTTYDVLATNGTRIDDAELMRLSRNAAERSEADAIQRQKVLNAAVNPTGLDSPLAILHSELPKYPSRVMDEEIEGIVEVQFVIDESGVVRDAVILASPDSRLSEACLTSIRRWRFAPPTKAGVPTSVRARQKFPFTLR